MSALVKVVELFEFELSWSDTGADHLSSRVLVYWAEKEWFPVLVKMHVLTFKVIRET